MPLTHLRRRWGALRPSVPVGPTGSPCDSGPSAPVVLLVLVAVCLFGLPRPAGAQESDSVPPVGDTAAASDSAPAVRDTLDLAVRDSILRAGAPVFQRPEHIRGIYLNAWAAGSDRKLSQLVSLARRTELNAFVVDLKDATGYVSWPTDLPMAREIGATGELRIRNLPGLLDRLKAAGIYPIARIVIIKDPLLAREKPELAIQDTAGGVWVDGKGMSWVNPYDERVWAYNVALAREAALMGFPEIQWDYVRFPDAPEAELARARFPGADGRTRTRAIRDFLTYAREALSDLDVEMTADVFGVTTTFRRDVGIGQLWEDFIDVVDVALPMVYPSHYWRGSYGFDEPNSRPYEVVYRALRDALERTAAVEGAGTVRPWLQDFTLGKPKYGPAEVRAQIQATYDAGIREWILWNPGNRYTEDALEPAGGYPPGWDPYIRVTGTLVPASKAMKAWEAAQAAARAAAAEAAAAVARDTMGDSIGAPDPPADTAGDSIGAAGPPADTTGSGGAGGG